MLYLAYVSPQPLYQDMQNFVVMVLMKLVWSKQSEKIIHNIISIFSEVICVVCPSGNRSFQIRHFSIQVRCWLY